MSKLDRFLVSDGIFLAFPAITAVCLDRHLSDHRPILLNEVHIDFGPTLFRIYHSWFKREGFDAMVELAWTSFTHSDPNRLIRFKKKLQDLKKIIRGWIKDQNISQYGTKQAIIDDLVSIDKKLDSGLASNTLLLERMELTCKLQDIIQLEVKDFVQKPKLNGRLRKAIGIPIRQWLKICSKITLPLDSHISLDEIRAAVWECGKNKSPYVLHAFGFGLNWCKWIRGIFSSTMATILINGSPTIEFLFFRGLKQGDPLAPLIFILIMESLHILVSRAVNEGVFKGLQLQESVSISHLFYANDAVFIEEWSDDNLVNLIRILNCFHLASGLKINVQKSQVLRVGISWDVVNQGATLIGCAVMHTPFKYLGVMVGDIMSRHNAWVNTIQKIQARLSKWKVKTLSVGDSSKTKITWVAWNKTLASKKNGGLGVSSFPTLNYSHSTHTTLIWCFILREVQVLSSKGFDFFSHCKIRIGNGLNTRFWLDNWISNMHLYVRYPRLFALERIKDVSVAVKCGDVSLDGSFRRQVCDLNGDGEFRVKDIRSFLDDLFLPSLTDATRWVKYIPVKVNVFVWRARLNRLPTRGNLVSRGVFLDSSLCSVCGLALEDVQHVFFRCDMAKLIFNRICRWWDLHWVDVSSFEDWDVWFGSIRLSSKLKIMLEGVFYISWWFIWSFRNRSIFDEASPRRSVLFDDIVSRSYFWFINRCRSSFSWEYWLKKPLFDCLVMFFLASC
uniref:RNA-directed DNA polymerase, eukaryota n=1 Tax=Tanacetum cinerariifolium TaxID=118510 RepID=A0A6L2KZA3_TANCI|nr:RNA-directed DNA polymerase, eukaryota [Tanacetum cinerariifolium]